MILSCPVPGCEFYIKIHGKTQWGKVNNAFIQHVIEQHTAKQVVDTLYLIASAKIQKSKGNLIDCPHHPGEKLVFEDQEYDSGDIYETVSCPKCHRCYRIHFVAADWKETS